MAEEFPAESQDVLHIEVFSPGAGHPLCTGDCSSHTSSLEIGLGRPVASGEREERRMRPVYAGCQRWPSGLCALPGDYTSTESALQSRAALSGSFSQDLGFGKPLL